MPYFDPLHPLTSAIIELLAETRDLSISELHHALELKHKIEVSRQNLYRTVSLLIEHQVMVRAKARLSLNQVWVAHLLTFGEKLRRNYNDADAIEVWIPQMEGDVREYSTDSLVNLDPIWNDGLLRLAHRSESKRWYVYNSHPWYTLGMYETEFRLYASIVSSGISCHMLYGNDTFLDRYGLKRLKVEGFHTSIGVCETFEPEGHALWVCDDFIVECRMPNAISNYFAFLFQSTTRIEEFEPQLFSDTFRMKGRCKITFRRDSQKAQFYRSVLAPYFEHSAGLVA